MLKVINTHTGKIYVDTDSNLEFLTVGDYGKENNIKANFLGLTKEIHGVKHVDVDLSKKWVATISTQKGCRMCCQFCDCPSFGFKGNISIDEMIYMIETILQNESCEVTDRFNVHFARMGEPTFNFDILPFTKYLLRYVVSKYIQAKTIHPVVSTMMPKYAPNLFKFLMRWCSIKNDDYKGEAGLQLSINSTNDKQREQQFNGYSLKLEQIAKIANKLPKPIGRKYTLNFAVTEATILDATRLNNLFDKNKFIVKITPIHQTKRALENGYAITSTYESYDVYKQFEQPLVELGWDVIVFVPSKEEDADRITCGNALITYQQ